MQGDIKYMYSLEIVIVVRSLRSPESYSLTLNQSILRSLFDMVATYFEFANVSDRL